MVNRPDPAAVDSDSCVQGYGWLAGGLAGSGLALWLTAGGGWLLRWEEGGNDDNNTRYLRSTTVYPEDM